LYSIYYKYVAQLLLAARRTTAPRRRNTADAATLDLDEGK